MNEKNLRLNLDKCIFRDTSVPFLGHIIYAGSIQPDPKNLSSIEKFQEPTNVKEVQCFLGMLNYYSDFLPNFSNLVEPLRKLTRKGVKFQWSKPQQNAFQTLKDMIFCDLRLGIFDPQFSTILSTDASDVGIGGVLSQIQYGKEVPIAFAHHTLNSRERGWAVNEREAFAAMYFCEYFEKYLLGRTFTLRSDHQPLMSLLQKASNKRQSSKFGRWAERLAEFDFKFEYKKGSENVVPDAISRLISESVEPSADLCLKLHKINEEGLSAETFKTATNQDPVLKKVSELITNGWPKSSRNLQPDVIPFFKLRQDLTMENGYVLRHQSGRILVPTSLRQDLLKKAHEGHPGIVRFKRKLRELYWWPGMDSESERFVKESHPCSVSEKSNPKTAMPQMHLYTPKTPWEELSMDIIGPFATAPSHLKFIVVLIDNCSKFPEILCTSDITSKKITHWLSEIFARYGNPAKIITDNGPQFKSKDFNDFMQNRDILHESTPVYTPQQNGFVESFNRYLKHGVQTFEDSHQQWLEGLYKLLSQFRSTSSMPNLPSPAEKFFGRTIRLPFQIVRNRKKRREEEEHEGQQDEQGNGQELPSFHKRGPYHVGQKVRVKRPHAPKGQSPWSKPLTVTKALGNWTYELSDGQIWNARRMRNYVEPPTLIHTPTQQDSTNLMTNKRFMTPRLSQRQNKGKPPERLGTSNYM